MAVTVISKKTSKEISQRRLEQYDRYSKVIDWGRAYPIEFGQRFMGADYLDIQKYITYNTWFADLALWLVCRNGSKTTMAAMYIMKRSLLFPFHATYILGNTGDQAKEVFKKIEKIAKHEISSFVGTTDFFFEEIIKSSAVSDGFVHAPGSFTLELFNGSTINTLNSDVVNIKGKRANLVFLDEAGWMADEMFIQTGHFTDQSESFKLGGGVNIEIEPKGFSRQIIQASSASDDTSEFYKNFKRYSELMIMGDRKYFSCNFDVDAILTAKKDGEPYPSLLSPDKVKDAMESNPEKGARELYNHFSAGVREGQILSRSILMQHTKPVPPLVTSPDGQRQFVFAWDAARINDNSIIGVAEFYKDEKGWKMRIVNVESLVDKDTKNKTPLTIPEQVERFKELLLKYNGDDHGRIDYENILALVCDSGAGGQAISIADLLLSDWIDKKGSEHKGIIDRAHKANEAASRRFPDAVDIVKLVNPRSSRNDIMDAAERMTKLGVVEFPAEYDGQTEIVSIDDDGKETVCPLSADEQIALAQISRMKDEITTMCKYVSGGNASYDFPPDKRNKMHDDRMFVYGLLCWYLAFMRKGQIVEKPKQEKGAVNSLMGMFKAPNITGRR